MMVCWHFADLSCAEGRRLMTSDGFGMEWYLALEEGRVACVLCGEGCTNEGSGPRSVVAAGWKDHPDGSLVVTLCQECGDRYESFAEAAKGVVEFIDAAAEAKRSTQH